MITYVKLTGSSVLKRLKAEEPVEMTFGPGLTVITGPNGSGKTTLISAVRAAIPRPLREQTRGDAYALRNAVEIVRDEREITFWNADLDDLRHQHHLAEREDDMFRQMAAVNASHGQANAIQVGAIIRRLKENRQFDAWLDEPDKGFSVHTTKNLAVLLRELARGRQIVVATCNPLLWTVADTLIETVPGYVAQVRSLLSTFVLDAAKLAPSAAPWDGQITARAEND